MELKEFLEDIDFDKQYKHLKNKLKSKKVVIYGSGALFQLINSEYDLSDINIIAISDGKYTQEDRDKSFLGYNTIPLNDVREQKPDYVVVAILNYTEIVYNLENVFLKESGIKVIPLVQKKFFDIIKEIWL